LERALADRKALRREHEYSLSVLQHHLACRPNRSLWQRLIGR
jgi:hypothetical protein